MYGRGQIFMYTNGNYKSLMKLALKQNTTSLGDGVKIYNINNQNFNANVFITRERYPFDSSHSYLSSEKEEHEQTINAEHCEK